mmetsp:Transcript_56165/g.93304  ORF Transcript_56165/g.93304 Transcript_56165/m.93304 type:complete len:211 (-) Transcript_56165:181-813(-)
MSRLMDQNVFWFDVSVEHAIDVKVFQCHQNFSSVKLGIFLRQPLSWLTLQEMKEFTSSTVFVDEVQLRFALERPVHPADERVVTLGQHLPLREHTMDLVAGQHVLLPQHLHGIHVLRVLLHHHVHTPHVTLAEQPHCLEVAGDHPPGDHAAKDRCARTRLDRLVEGLDVVLKFLWGHLIRLIIGGAGDALCCGGNPSGRCIVRVLAGSRG